MLTPIPGGVGCIVYKSGAPCNVQLYLTCEEVLLDDIYQGEVCVSKIVFDTTMTNVFAAFAASKPEEELYADTVYSSSVNFGVADHSGPAVLYTKHSMTKKDVSSLPILLSNCVSYQLQNKDI